MAPRDPDRRAGRATSYDVARLAGVSQSAVSRAFSPGGSVSGETRERILEAARSLGYRPNAIARGLITRRSNLVGLILPAMASLYYPEIMVEITAEVARRGARVLLITVEDPAEVGAALEQLWSFQVDGVIAATAMTAEQLEDFELHRTPVIFYNRAPPHHAGNSVAVDHADGEGRLVDRLWQAGHRRFAMITGPDGSEVAQQRAAGARATLERLGGCITAVTPGDYRYESGIEAFGRLWTGGERFDVVLCANDAMALGAMDAARLKHGLRVPEDVSVAGFDGFNAGRWLAYQLTTVRQPIGALAAAAVEMLFARIEEPDLAPERRLFSGEIVPGRSARLAPSGGMSPVVLAPGLLCDDRLWSAVTPLLAGPVVTVDFAEDDTIEAMAERILAEGPERFVLAGFSMGGMAAVVAAARAPERIAGLVLIDTHAEPETPDRSERRARQIATADAGGFARLVREELKPVYFAEPEAYSDERRLVSDMALEAGSLQFRRHVQALMLRPDPTPLLPALTMPVTVVTGEADGLAPPEAARRLAAAVPDGRLVLIPDCGHMAPLEAPAAVAAEINALCRQLEPA